MLRKQCALLWWFMDPMSMVDGPSVCYLISPTLKLRRLQLLSVVFCLLVRTLTNRHQWFGTSKKVRAESEDGGSVLFSWDVQLM